MKSVLVIFFLSVQSNYFDNTETDATDVDFDTVQFFATDQGNWRIKTYAINQDVHVWSMGGTPDDILDLARQNTEKHYGDVLTEGYILESTDGVDGLRNELRNRGLDDHLEISKSGFVFWAPAGSNYHSRSTPQQD
jgi:hypothetical protein